MRTFIKKIPILRSIAKIVYFSFIAPFKSFSGSENYWKNRYKNGGNSGAGSYHSLADFKAETLNDFVRDNRIRTIIEYGCGDGNQLKLAEYPSFVGFDISQEAISLCETIFSNDKTKSFKLMDAYANEKAQLTLSLDVIYHLVENNTFSTYMNRLFDTSTKFVIIYSSNINKQARLQAPHVKHRKFTNWIEENQSDWKLIQRIPNKYPYTNDEFEGSFADFYIYERT